MQQRDGGVVFWLFDPVRIATTSFAGKSETEVVFYFFEPVRAAATFITCNSETGVDFLCYFNSIPPATPPRMRSCESDVSFRALRPRFNRRYLPHMEQRV